MNKSDPSPKKRITKKVSEIVKDDLISSAITEPVLHVGAAALAAQFPIAGPFVGLLSNLIPSRKQMRMERNLEDCFRRLEAIEVVLDQDWIKSDEFGFLFEECVRGFADNYHKEKLDAFKAILIKGAVGSNLEVSEQEYYLGLVHRLTPLHIKLLKILDEARRIPQGGPPSQIPYGTIQSIIGVDPDILIAAYADLETLQFTNTDSRNIGSYLRVPLDRIGGRINQAATKFLAYITLAS